MFIKIGWKVQRLIAREVKAAWCNLLSRGAQTRNAPTLEQKLTRRNHDVVLKDLVVRVVITNNFLIQCLYSLKTETHDSVHAHWRRRESIFSPPAPPRRHRSPIWGSHA